MSLIEHTDPPKVWTGAAADAIAAGAPVPVITAWLDHGLTPEPVLFMRAAQAHRADVLTLLFNAARPWGQGAIDAGALAALTPPSALDRCAFDDIDTARAVLANATRTVMNQAKSWVHGGAAVPVWWHAFRNADESQDLAVLLVLLREHGADLAGTPFSDMGATNGGKHGEALRAFLLAERIEAERAVLRQTAAETEAVVLVRRARL
ncbi:hypothetical protein [Burkholderia vietnamiensis]|uniref:hypothetical protein n=1 Tax=Burkholderia vietnamiensis TaxID=60552 RepID=UPI0015930525|nr:hypothetical protein [Burkholderia vietnamiensis]